MTDVQKGSSTGGGDTPMVLGIVWSNLLVIFEFLIFIYEIKVTE